MKVLFIIITIFLSFSCNAEDTKKIVKLEIKKNTIKKSDTLDIGYTYWWPASGPFIGLCGEPYSLVFLGELVNIEKSKKSENSLYTSQKGKVEIKNIIVKKDLKKEKYNNEKFFTSNSFYDSKLKIGDKVIVFIYEYQGHFSIPGKDSIIKIDKFDSPIVNSIKKYIKSGQNPLSIKDDINLWTKYGFGKSLKEVIECQEHFLKKKQIK